MLPPTASLRALVRLAHQRSAIEQQYHELKDEIGLDHFEGRTVPGWERHVVLTASAYSFPQSEPRRRGQTHLTLPQVRAVIHEMLTPYFFLTHPHYLRWMLKLKDVELRICQSSTRPTVLHSPTQGSHGPRVLPTGPAWRCDMPAEMVTCADNTVAVRLSNHARAPSLIPAVRSPTDLCSMSNGGTFV